MVEPCRITAYKADDERTELKVTVKGDIEEQILRYQKNGTLTGELRIDDGRHISAIQRRKIYANIADIAYYCGEVPEYTKELFKFLYISETGAPYFSLSDCSMEVAKEYISFLIDFALEHDIPLSDPGLQRTDDIERYLWSCIKHKRCCLCGKPADVHHCTGSRIGMGNDRRKISNEGRELISLCREHHTELHTKPESEFFEKHHVFGVIYREDRDDK